MLTTSSLASRQEIGMVNASTGDHRLYADVADVLMKLGYRPYSDGYDAFVWETYLLDELQLYTTRGLPPPGPQSFYMI